MSNNKSLVLYWTVHSLERAIQSFLSDHRRGGACRVSNVCRVECPFISLILSGHVQLISDNIDAVRWSIHSSPARLVSSHLISDNNEMRKKSNKTKDSLLNSWSPVTTSVGSGWVGSGQLKWSRWIPTMKLIGLSTKFIQFTSHVSWPSTNPWNSWVVAISVAFLRPTKSAMPNTTPLKESNCHWEKNRGVK